MLLPFNSVMRLMFNQLIKTSSSSAVLTQGHPPARFLALLLYLVLTKAVTNLWG